MHYSFTFILSVLNKLGKQKKIKVKHKGCRRFLRILRNVLIIFIVITILPVIIYKWVNPPITPLMLIRKFEGNSITKDWVPISEMSAYLPQAAIVAEDDEFMNHYGFDIDAMQQAYKKNKRQSAKIRGGSTISQQTAKNVFLWPYRDYLRKTIEAWFTVLIELFWGKERIMEVYLNVVEMGKGIYGVEAASQKYFHKHAKNLNKNQAVSLIAVLPNPRTYKVINPSPYIQTYRNNIAKRMGKK